MFNFLSSMKHDYTCAQIAAVENRITTLKDWIKEANNRRYDLEREIDYYDDQLTKAMEKRLDLIEKMDEAHTSSISKTTQKLA